MLSRLFWLPIALALGLHGCSGDPTEPTLEDPDLTVMFVGNSLTYTNNLPGLVETVAEAAGYAVETISIAGPNYGLGDHWVTGTPRTIREQRPDVVVLQQGPSTLAESRAYLVEWTDSLARVAREVGADPALLMVWPPDDPDYSFGAVYASYLAAAEAVGGTFIPAGMAWVEVRKSDGTLALYGPDGFHPDLLGSVVAAMTIVETLFEGSVRDLPPNMTPSRRNPDIRMPPATLETLVGAVQRAVERYARR
ncbi:MAG: SGNH/GDSL hydrolase family protein [Gemmatimonadetes bacterium]|nr:SGNH/GDSL hydrolase family protein [Gemmatimonadota bacterium]NNF37471.1 SGNH/GDSL hydrolase family protein [Gemmatimonadota bacterium]